MADNSATCIESISPARAFEKDFTFQHSIVPEQLGLIGHLRGDFGPSGMEFWTTFFDAVPALKTQEFKDDFDMMVNHLRSKKCGLLRNRADMISYAEKNDTCRFDTFLGTSYIFRIDTKSYRYYLRCLPQKGNYNFYLWCYVKDIIEPLIGVYLNKENFNNSP